MKRGGSCACRYPCRLLVGRHPPQGKTETKNSNDARGVGKRQSSTIQRDVRLANNTLGAKQPKRRHKAQNHKHNHSAGNMPVHGPREDQRMSEGTGGKSSRTFR